MGRSADPGLCGNCDHSRRIRSDRDSVFWLCRLSERDESFPRYPRLPVRACRGYQRAATGAGDP